MTTFINHEICERCDSVKVKFEPVPALFHPNNACCLTYFDGYLRIGSCLACVYRVMDARGKFGEHEKRVRVARGVAESNSSFLSALETFQVHP